MFRKGGRSKASKDDSDSDFLARLAEAKKETAVLKLKNEEMRRAIEEERAKREAIELEREELRRATEEERAKLEAIELEREELRRATEEERAKREAIELEREELRRATEEERAAIELEREELRRATEEERKRREEVDAAEFLNQPLQKARLTLKEVEFPELPAEATTTTADPTSTSSLSQKTSERFMPYVTQPWDQFETEMETMCMNVANRIVKRPVEQTIKNTIFDHERMFELFWGNSREATLKVMEELYPNSPLAHGMSTTTTKGPGRPDELFTVPGQRHVSTLERRHPAVEFHTDRSIPDILREGEPETERTPKRYALCTLIQSYTYMIQIKLKYGIFSNWDHWIFMKREINDERKEVLYVSPWIGLDRARLGWATLIYLACRDTEEKECQEVGDFGKVPTWIRSSTRQTEPGNAGDGGGSSSNTGRGGGEGGANSHHAIRAAYPETTTHEALGVTALSLVKSYQILGHTEKSHTRRVHVNGRDLVVKLVDYLGVPKHSEFSAQDLNDFEWNEVRIYHYLQQQGAQGRLAPYFLYHGSDFNQIWATAVTTYEGESLATILQQNGSLIPAVQTAAITALRELHELGVIHGDASLRNAIWRPSDGKVIWVDYELAQLQSDCLELFACQALSEIRELEALLRETPNPPASASPSRVQPPSQVASNDEKEPTAKKICPCLQE